jgi:hypothetical protein
MKPFIGAYSSGEGVIYPAAIKKDGNIFAQISPKSRRRQLPRNDFIGQQYNLMVKQSIEGNFSLDNLHNASPGQNRMENADQQHMRNNSPIFEGNTQNVSLPIQLKENQLYNADAGTQQFHERLPNINMRRMSSFLSQNQARGAAGGAYMNSPLKSPPILEMDQTSSPLQGTYLKPPQFVKMTEKPAAVLSQTSSAQNLHWTDPKVENGANN